MKRALREVYIWAFFLILLIAVVTSNTSVRSAFDFLIFLIGIAVKAGLIMALSAPVIYVAIRLERRVFRGQK